MEEQGIAFVIMQIGNPDLDKIYTDIFRPAIESTGLDPRRIDQDNSGNLLKKEIVEYIEKAEIIIADITNERPNCYLEIGYAMGLDKYKNLIFTVREDHHHESENYKKGGPKIHFDVSGYDILFWDPKKLEDFKNALTNKINRRLVTINPAPKELRQQLWDKEWLQERRNFVVEKFDKLGFKRNIEILISPINFKLNISQSELLDITDKSQIETTGWPIGIVFIHNPSLKPLPKSDGILSEIYGIENRSYDYSYFKKNGQIFISKSPLEEHFGLPESIIPDERIRRTTEVLLYVLRFYSRCKLPVNERIEIEIKYTGLLNNAISYGPNGNPLRPTKSSENECVLKIITSLSDIEKRLPEIVQELVNGLLVLFDFYVLDFEHTSSIVNEFVNRTNKTRR